MRTVIRALAVGLFLFTLHAARPAAMACSEYQCRIPVGPDGGGGSYCINVGEEDCICNYVGCMCGQCECDDEGDCVLMPYQG